MNRFKEFMKNMTKQAWITTAIIGALLLIVLVGGLIKFIGPSKSHIVSYKKDTDKTQNAGNSDVDSFITSASNNVFVKENPKSEYAAGATIKPIVTPVVSYEAKKQEVQIALIIEENQYDVKNIIEGVCGNSYLVTAYMPGPDVLTNSFKALFGDKIFADFMPGNIIPTYHHDLRFKEVTITNGVARIYLTGSFTETQKKSCDTQLAIAQLTETAKSYPNVKSVEIYLNSKLVK